MKGSQSVERGWKAYSRGDIAQAENEFELALSQSPEKAFAALQRGMFFLRQDRFAEAAGSFELAVSKEPKNPAPLFFLTIAHELGGQPEAADTTLERLQAVSPRHQGLASLTLLKELRRGDPLPVLRRLKLGAASGSKEGWRAIAAGLGVGDPSWLPPELSSSEYLLGPILLEIEKRLLPRELPQLEHRTGNLLEDLKTLKPPKRTLKEELAGLRASWKGGAKLRRGQRLLSRAWQLGTPHELKEVLNQAIGYLEEGQRLDPYAFRTHYYLGEAYLLSAKTLPGKPWLREPLLKAESHFLDSVRLDGSNPYVLLYLAVVQLGLGRPQAAIDCYLKSTEKFTKMPEAHYGIGQCYLLLGQPRPAREYLLKACSSDLLQARERLNLFALLLEKEGPEALANPLPDFVTPASPPQAESHCEPAEGEAKSTPTESVRPPEPATATEEPTTSALADPAATPEEEPANAPVAPAASSDPPATPS